MDSLRFVKWKRESEDGIQKEDSAIILQSDLKVKWTVFPLSEQMWYGVTFHMSIQQWNTRT